MCIVVSSIRAMCPAQRFQVDTEESLLVVTLLFPSYLGETNLDSPEDGGECNENVTVLVLYLMFRLNTKQNLMNLPYVNAPRTFSPDLEICPTEYPSRSKAILESNRE